MEWLVPAYLPKYTFVELEQNEEIKAYADMETKQGLKETLQIITAYFETPVNLQESNEKEEEVQRERKFSFRSRPRSSLVGPSAQLQSLINDLNDYAKESKKGRRETTLSRLSVSNRMKIVN